MVDPDLLRRKTEQILHRVARLRRRSPLDPAMLGRDEDLLNTVSMDLQQAIQAAIDLAVHACADDGLGAPDGPAQAFRLLADAERIDPALAQRLTGAAGLRNLIVHRYADLDLSRLIDSVDHHLGDLTDFARAMRG